MSQHRGGFGQRRQVKVQRRIGPHARAGGIDQQHRHRPQPSASRSSRPARPALSPVWTATRQGFRRDRASRLRIWILAGAQQFQRQNRAARRPARTQQHDAFAVQASPMHSRKDSARPSASVLRPSMPSSRKTSRLAAPAAYAGPSALCARAKAASLCGTVTLTPLKPARRTPSITAAKSSRRGRKRHHGAVNAMFGSQ